MPSILPCCAALCCACCADYRFLVDDPVLNTDARELLWAARGGGGGQLGIITEFVFRLPQLPQAWDQGCGAGSGACPTRVHVRYRRGAQAMALAFQKLQAWFPRMDARFGGDVAWQDQRMALEVSRARGWEGRKVSWRPGRTSAWRWRWVGKDGREEGRVTGRQTGGRTGRLDGIACGTWPTEWLLVLMLVLCSRWIACCVRLHTPPRLINKPIILPPAPGPAGRLQLLLLALCTPRPCIPAPHPCTPPLLAGCSSCSWDPQKRPAPCWKREAC